jgi:predicted nucleic acid-binding Zn ribbon protein
MRKTQQKKKKKNGTQWIFVGILILVMIEDVKR